MTRPLLVDLFCCAGGAAMGYHRAGFDIIGVDKEPQPNYPFEFVQADVLDLYFDEGLEMLGRRVRAIHASPPCQFATAYRRRQGVAEDAVNLIPQTRELMESTGLHYVIENVDQKLVRAELLDPIKLCGSMFGLDVQRHRLFESSFPLEQPRCDHGGWEPRFPPATNRTNLRKTVEVGVWRIPLETQQRAMGMDWSTLEELSQAIPPAYTEYIGKQLMAHLKTDASKGKHHDDRLPPF